jgi:hypothetical protein
VALIEAERLLIQIPEQVERFDRNISPVQPALQETPEVFHPIGVNFSANILNRVVDYFMLKLTQALVGLQRIGEQRGARQYMLAHMSLNGHAR